MVGGSEVSGSEGEDCCSGGGFAGGAESLVQGPPRLEGGVMRLTRGVGVG